MMIMGGQLEGSILEEMLLNIIRNCYSTSDIGEDAGDLCDLWRSQYGTSLLTMKIAILLAILVNMEVGFVVELQDPHIMEYAH